MADRAQARLDEEARQVTACRAGVKTGHEYTIPHESGSEYQDDTESSSESDD